MAQPDVPVWPRETTGFRVLVECEDPAVQDGVERALRTAGYVTAACAGPTSRSSGECPLVVDGRCGLVEDANVIVQACDPDGTHFAQVLAAIRHHCPDTPVVIEVSTGTDARDADIVARCHTLRFPVAAGAVVETVRSVAMPLRDATDAGSDHRRH
jgi:hypothetical protein